MLTEKMYSVEEAVRAQRALRQTSGPGPELFPIEAFVGMISDEVETLRANGKSDEEIAAIIRESSAIDITAAETSQHYAAPEECGHH